MLSGLTEGATEQAGAIEEITAQVENVTKMTNDNAEETLKAAESIETIADEAMQGQEEVYRLIPLWRSRLPQTTRR